MRKRILALTIFAAATAVAVVLGFWWGRSYLRNEIVRQLEDATGNRVQVASVSLGLRQQLATGVSVSQDDNTWLTIERVILDLPLMQAVWGETRPDELTAVGTSVQLALGADGRFVPPWQSSATSRDLPADRVQLRDVTVTLEQPGRQDLILRNVAVVVTQEDDRIDAQGTVGDVAGSEWTFNARAAVNANQFTLQTQTDAFDADAQTLSRLPLAPEQLAAVDFRFQTSVDATVRHENGLTGYRVQLRPSSLTTQLPGLQLPLREGTGHVLLTESALTIDRFRAQLGDGEIQVSGQATLAGLSADGSISVNLRGLSLDSLPPTSPNLRPAGLAEGEFQLGVTYRDGVTISGQGTLQVNQARINDLPLETVGVEIDLLPTAIATERLSGTATLTAAATVDLQEAVTAFSLEDQLQASASGRVDATGTITVPLDQLNDLSSIQGTATLSAGEVLIEGIPLQRITANVELAESVVRVDRLSAAIGPRGQLDGSFQLPMQQDKLLATEVRITDLDVPWALQQLARIGVQRQLADINPDRIDVQGPVNIDATLSLPFRAINDTERWQASGSVSSNELFVDGERLRDAGGDFQLQGNELRLSNLRTTWRDVTPTGEATVLLTESGSFQAEGNLPWTNISNLLEIVDAASPVELTGKVQLSGEARGTISPLEWTAAGRAGTQLEHDLSGQFVWAADNDTLSVQEARLDAFGGVVKFAAELALPSASTSSISGSFSNLDPKLLLQFVETEVQEASVEVPVPLEGRLTGSFSGRNLMTPQTSSAEIQFQGLSTRAEGVPITDLAGTMTLVGDKVTGLFQSALLGGTAKLEGTATLKRSPQFSLAEPDAELTLTGLQLEQAQALPFLATPLRRFGGRASIVLDVDWDAENNRLVGEGTLSLEDLRWQQRAVANQLTAQLKLDGTTLAIQDLAMPLAQGSVQGDLTIQLGNPPVGTFNANLTRVSSQQLTRWFGQRIDTLEGPVSMSLRGNLGPTIAGSGTLSWTRGEWRGIPIEGVRAPFTWNHQIGTGQGRAKIRLSSARVANGPVKGKVDLGWGSSLSLRGDAQFSGVNVRPLARSVSNVRDLMKGKLQGRIEFNGRNVRGADDLNGKYDLELDDGQTLALPVLESLTPLLGFQSPISPSFRSTKAKGTLRRGVLYLDQLTIDGGENKIWIDGKVHLRGRIDLDVTAQTPQLRETAVFLGIVRPTEFLRQRLLFLHVGGTVRSPIVRPRTAEMLQQEVLLFLIPGFSIPGAQAAE